MASRPASAGPEVVPSEVTHVFFDVGGTLVSSSPVPADIFREALRKRGHLIDPQTVARTLRSPDLIVTLIQPMLRGREADFYRSVNARLVEHMGLHADDAALDDIHASFEREVVYRPYPDAVRTLKALRSAGYRTGVVSNFSHRLPEVLDRLGLGPYLDPVTYSFEAGAEKPHPKIFRTALARAGAAPERALMVGDSFEADYVGARRAGLHAVLLCRAEAVSQPCPSITGLGELTRVLGGPRPRRGARREGRAGRNDPGRRDD